MAQITKKNVAGKDAGTVDLDERTFGIQPNVPVMHQVVTAQLAGARAGTASTKTRGEVRGGVLLRRVEIGEQAPCRGAFGARGTAEPVEAVDPDAGHEKVVEATDDAALAGAECQGVTPHHPDNAGQAIGDNRHGKGV